MRHSYFGKKLSRTKNERRRLIMGLARDLIMHGQVRTTRAKAKAVQPFIEKLITKAKTGTSASYRVIEQNLVDARSIKKLRDEAGTRFASRSSGYTQILRLGSRRGDNGSEVLFRFIDPGVIVEVVKPQKTEGKGVVKAKEDKKLNERHVNKSKKEQIKSSKSR